jgi:hypothetical protein
MKGSRRAIRVCTYRAGLSQSVLELHGRRGIATTSTPPLAVTGVGDVCATAGADVSPYARNRRTSLPQFVALRTELSDRGRTASGTTKCASDMRAA